MFPKNNIQLIYVVLQQDHLQSCQYTTVECRNTGCGERVFINKLEHHLKNECLQRLVKCKDCGKDLMFRELKVVHIQLNLQFAGKINIKSCVYNFQTHSGDCPNALRKCENCQQEIPALKVLFITELHVWTTVACNQLAISLMLFTCLTYYTDWFLGVAMLLHNLLNVQWDLVNVQNLSRLLQVILS